MSRERTAWLLSFLLLTVVAFRDPASAQRDRDYLFVRTLVDINRQVVSNYVEPVDGQKLEKAAIDGMLGQLDPHTVYIPPAQQEEFERRLTGTFRGVGVELSQQPGGPVEVVTPIDGSPAFEAGVKAGDAILKVNGESVENLRLPDVIKKISGEAGTSVTLTVRHTDGKVVDLTMKRQEIVIPPIKGYRRNANDTWDYYVVESPKIAYVRISQFTPSTYDTLRPVLENLVAEGMKGLIMDLRWNPGGQLDQAVKIVDMFIDKGTIVSTRYRNRPEETRSASANGTLPWFPMIVLVNEHSASAAEIVAGSLLDNKRAAVLGARSYGKGSVQEVIPLEGNNGELKLTVAYYYLPSGRLVHRKKDATDWGVEPQINVPMDDETQIRVMKERDAYERFVRPGTNPSTRPTTQPTDLQLQRAVDTMILMTVLQQSPATQPADGKAER